jgi:hypothetical protein
MRAPLAEGPRGVYLETVSDAGTQMLGELRPAESASSRDRRSFLRRVGLASLGAAAAVPVLARDDARAASLPAYSDLANTFTAPQTISSQNPPLTIKGVSPGYSLHVRDRASNAFIARMGSSAPPGEVAGVLVLHGSNGLGTYGAAWQLGIDVSVPPRNRDFFIAKVEADDSVRDVIYMWNNGAGNEPAIDLFPAGPSYPVNASVAINGRSNRQADPPMLMLRPNAALDGNAMVIKALTEAQPRWGIDKDGAQSWGPGGSTAPGGRSGATGVTLERAAGSGLRVSQGGGAPGISRALVLNNSRTRAHGDGTGMTFEAQGLPYARIDGTYYTYPGGRLSLSVLGAGNSFVERIAIDNLGIGFNGAKPIVVPTYGSATASTRWGATEQQMLNRLYTLIKTLGFFN